MRESIEIQMSKILEDVNAKLDEKTEKIVQKIARKTAKRLREISPKRSGEYAKSWSVKKGKGGAPVVYNKLGRLTHLLEHGHLSKNHFGIYGRVAGIPHISRAYEEGKQDLAREIEAMKL